MADGMKGHQTAIKALDAAIRIHRGHMQAKGTMPSKAPSEREMRLLKAARAALVMKPKV